jgi:hypothetical protein
MQLYSDIISGSSDRISLRAQGLRDLKSKELSHPKSVLHCTSQSIATGLAADDWVPPCRLIDAVAIADIL